MIYTNSTDLSQNPTSSPGSLCFYVFVGLVEMAYLRFVLVRPIRIVTSRFVLVVKYELKVVIRIGRIIRIEGSQFVLDV